MERIKESKLTVVYTVEDFCGENYPIVSNGYTIKNEDLNSVIVNIPKTLFVDNIGRIGIRTLFCGYGSGFYIYYKHQDNGIFISRKYIKGALDNEE